MNAIIYTRVSSEEQAGDEKLSLTDQEQRCRDWCAREGHVVVGVFSDPGVSGATLDRSGLNAALDTVRRGGVDLFVAKRIDRLSRNTDHVGHLAYVLDGYGAKLDFVDESFAATPMGKLLRTISAWRGEEEREVIRSRVRVGRKGRAIAGKTNAPVQPFGYRREVIAHKPNARNGRDEPVYGDVVIDEYEAAWVRKVFEMYLADGMPLRQIAFKLSEAGVPMRRGAVGRWSAEPVRRILTREAYTGQGWQNVRDTVIKDGKKKHYRTRPREEWLPIEFPAIISRATFDAAQERIAQNRPWRRPAAGRSERHLLQALVYCQECGNKLLSHTGGGSKRQRVGYVCQSQLRRGAECRTPMWIKAANLEGPVWERIVEACQNPDLWMASSAAADAQAGALETDAHQLLEDVRGKRAKAQEERQRLIRNVATGVLEGADSDVKAILSEYDERIDAWDHEVSRLEARTGDYARQAVERDQAEALAREIGPRVGRLSFEQRRELVRAMVRRIWVDGAGNISIEAAIPYLENRAAVVTSVPWNVTTASPVGLILRAKVAA